MASTSNQPFCHITFSGQTGRQKDRPTVVYQERLRSIILTVSDALTNKIGHFGNNFPGQSLVLIGSTYYSRAHTSGTDRQTDRPRDTRTTVATNRPHLAHVLAPCFHGRLFQPGWSLCTNTIIRMRDSEYKTPCKAHKHAVSNARILKWIEMKWKYLILNYSQNKRNIVQLYTFFLLSIKYAQRQAFRVSVFRHFESEVLWYFQFYTDI